MTQVSQALSETSSSRANSEPLTVKPAALDSSSESRTWEPQALSARPISEPLRVSRGGSSSSSDRTWTQEAQGGTVDVPSTSEFLEPTSQEVMEWMLLQSTTFWNFEMQDAACCYYHAAGRQCRNLGKSMMSKRCRRQWPDRLAAQCDSCGVMLLSVGEVCCFCEAGPQPSDPASDPGASPSPPRIQETEVAAVRRVAEEAENKPQDNFFWSEVIAKRNEIMDMKKKYKKDGKSKEEMQEAIAPLLDQLKELKDKAKAAAPAGEGEKEEAEEAKED